MPRLPAYFYQFSATHAFLNGLVAFFIPVLLWRSQHSLSVLAAFVSLSGLGFLGALLLWEKIRNSRRVLRPLYLSYIGQGVLALLVTRNPDSVYVLAPLAVLCGLCNCFYFVSLRTLFVSLPRVVNNCSVTGNRFGNFQLTVALFLKTGLLLGSLLLGYSQTAVLLLDWLFVGLGIALALACRHQTDHPLSAALSAPPVRIRDLAHWGRGTWMRPVFVVDGLFLFLETWFWILSLYLLGSQSLSRLGITVIALALLLSLTFLVIKRWIDKSNAINVFRLALLLYAGAWCLRGLSSTIIEPTLLTVVILTIAFTTSFFRLAFNKLFFDRMEPDQTVLCILAKSWYTQTGVTVFFALLALLLLEHPGVDALPYIYWCSAPLALVYMLYSLENTSEKPVGDRVL